ncbi:MAG TPA: hypothetical protein PKE64_08365 [Anaerolineae bacterium]|nr:hypothetical protein [Anaerolineae bacterium]HMR64007.1 hypothetical protein [Anaerolineae bacterium]
MKLHNYMKVFVALAIATSLGLIVTSLGVCGGSVVQADNEKVLAEGTFEVSADFSTLTITPVGSSCVLQVEGSLEFRGTLEGSGSAQTRTLVFAPCEDVMGNPPGTFADVVTAYAGFEGTVSGSPANATVTYLGKTEEGGAIAGLMTVKGRNLTGLLDVAAQVAEGGSYDGYILNKD